MAFRGEGNARSARRLLGLVGKEAGKSLFNREDLTGFTANIQRQLQ